MRGLRLQQCTTRESIWQKRIIKRKAKARGNLYRLMRNYMQNHKSCWCVSALVVVGVGAPRGWWSESGHQSFTSPCESRQHKDKFVFRSLEVPVFSSSVKRGRTPSVGGIFLSHATGTFSFCFIAHFASLFYNVPWKSRFPFSPPPRS